MLNKRKIAAIFVLLMASVVCTIFSAGFLNSHDPTADPQGVPSLAIIDPSLIRNTMNLNGSFTLLNTDGIAIEINEFRINDITLDKVSGLTVYANGTSINCSALSLFELKSGDTVHVNMMIPYENNSYLLSTLKNNHFEVQVRIPDAQFWKELN